MGFVHGPGPNSNAIGGGFSSQFPRQPLPPAMFNSSMPEPGPTRFHPPFFGNFSSLGPSAATSTASSSLAATPSPPPIIPNASPFFLEHLASAAGATCFHGIGVIVWLAGDRGLIEKIPDDKDEVGDRGTRSPNDDNNNRNNEAAGGSKPASPRGLSNLQIAFGIKELCDQNVNDLTAVLRVGFLVKYQAVMDLQALASGVGGKLQPPRLVATFVCPLSVTDWSTASSSVQAAAKRLLTQLDSPTAEPLPSEDTNRRRNSYDLEFELRAIHLLMNIYREQPSAGPQCPLSTFHCIVSNCGDEQMYRYIGTSSQKRRQFVERRRHFFVMTPDDTVCLVPSAVYTVVVALSRELLQRGGAMHLQELFNQYLNWPDLPLEARELVGETKPSFVQFLQSHPFIFSIFPSKVFVSLHRRLADFDYGEFLEEVFGDQEGSPYFAQCQSAMSTSPGGSQAAMNMGGPNGGSGGAFGHGQQPPPMMMTGRWNMDERTGNFGANGPPSAQGAPPGRHLVSPPVFPQPTPPAYPQSTAPRFAHGNSINYNAFAAPPPPVTPGPRLNAPGYGLNQWPPPPPHGPMAMPECMPPPSTMSCNMGGSSHSLSSGYSTGPAPSTPGLGPGQGQQYWPGHAGAGRQQTIPTPDNVAGFWKSYDLGTETLIRQLNSAGPGQQNKAPRATPTPPMMPPPEFVAVGGGSRRASQMGTPENIFLRPSSSASSSASCKGMLTNDSLAQTERFLLTLKCGHCGLDNEWLFPLLNHAKGKTGLVVKMKPETAEASVQTDQASDAGTTKAMADLCL